MKSTKLLHLGHHGPQLTKGLSELQTGLKQQVVGFLVKLFKTNSVQKAPY